LSFVFIGFGSNLDNPINQCLSAIKHIQSFPETDVIQVSPFYHTEPFGPVIQPWFINGVIQISTNLEPFRLLLLCQEIEHNQSRTRSLKWEPRTIDLDILYWEDRIVVSRQLTIPHQWMHLRRFVLRPFADIDPEIAHPLSGITIKNLLSRLNDPLRVKKIEKTLDHGDSK